ncbi:four helix bundle protein [Opitutaceae bacterium EW11]|nr:four helix bundle protein [Opitutaceae bacterium EW11]
MLHQTGDLRSRTFQFARRISRVFEALPRKRLANIYGVQLVRSANSVAANYREAQRARSKAEHFSKLGDCLREADETLYWLEAIEADALLSAVRLSEIKDECGQLVAIFVTLLKKR